MARSSQLTRLAVLLPHAAARGGIERIGTNLVNHLQGAADISLLVHDRVPVFAVRDDSLAVVRLSSRLGLPLAPPRWNRAVKALPALVSYLRRERPDVLLALQSPPLAALAIALARVPTALLARESNSLEAVRGNRVVRGIKLRLKRWSYMRAARVVALCDEMAEELATRLAIPRSKLVRIYNPTVTPELLGMAAGEVSHPWLAGGPDDPPVVLATGRFEHQKGFDTLLRAFALVAAERDCRLVLLGDGALRGELERLARELGIADRALLSGFADNPFSHIARATVFVLSSRYEGLVNVLIEAQACGTAVVATACPTSPREILLDGAAGALVGVDDAPAMARAITAYLDDPQLRERHIAAGRKRLNRFDADARTRDYIDLIGELAR